MRFELYRGYSLRGRVWRWRLVVRNGNVIANGGQGYSRKLDATEAIKAVQDTFDTPVITVGER